MRLGRVIGKVWADHKAGSLKACPLYLVQPTAAGGAKAGDALVVADPQRLAGPGDRIVYVTGTDAAQAFDSGWAPVNASIVERVDDIVS
jgi:ethanolamine utilization protein EutN